MAKTILIVDDEEKIAEVISKYLNNAGYDTREVVTAKEALTAIRTYSIDFAILDLMLPDMRGEELCTILRKETSIPILMLTAKVREHERINGLALGADDYMIKPFSPKELVMRVKTIFRRVHEHDLLADRISYDKGDLTIDASAQEVYREGKSVGLTKVEFKTLLVLARHPNRTFSREELVEKVLGFDYEGETRTIDQHIKNLRYKIEPDPKHPSFIQTVFGVGYRFKGDSS